MRQNLIKKPYRSFTVYIQGRKLELNGLFISLSTGKKTRIKGTVYQFIYREETLIKGTVY